MPFNKGKGLLLSGMLSLAMIFGTVSQGYAREFGDSLRYSGEIGATFSGGAHTPFWMVNGQDGFSSIKKNNGWLRLGIFHDLDHNKKFSWGAGVDLGVAANFTNVFIPQQIYAEIKYRCLYAMAGQKEMGDDIIHNDLSSGALTVSNNARPIPQIRIGIFDYADFWGCKGWFAVKGYLGYGMFTDNGWIKKWVSPQSEYTLNTKYATRALYFRFGNEKKFPLVGEFGNRMDSQFGGTMYYPEKDGERKVYHHPGGIKAWIKGMIPLAGGSDTALGEQNNVEGNYLGNWAFALGWYDPRGWSVRAYYEHFYEDHSMLTFDYPWKDGLYGIETKLPKNRWVSDIVAELLYTKDQAGPVYYDHTPEIDYQVSARDGYYNNYLFNGWQNYGYSIGNPLMIAPIYNNNGFMEFFHNRVVAWNVGLKGSPSPQVDWKLRVTGINSWGTYDIPTKKILKDVSLLAEVKYHPLRLKGWEGTLSFGMDRGNLVGQSFGFGISIAKVGFIKF